MIWYILGMYAGCAIAALGVGFQLGWFYAFDWWHQSRESRFQSEQAICRKALTQMVGFGVGGILLMVAGVCISMQAAISASRW